MKKLLSLYVIVGLGLVFILYGIIGPTDYNCQKKYDRMESIVKCMEMPACLVSSEAMYECKRAATYYENNCKEYEFYRQLKKQPKK